MNHLKPGLGALVFRLEPFGEFGIKTLVGKEGPAQEASVEPQGFLCTATLGACWIWLKPVKLYLSWVAIRHQEFSPDLVSNSLLKPKQIKVPIMFALVTYWFKVISGKLKNTQLLCFRCKTILRQQ